MVGAYSIGNAQRPDLDPLGKSRKTIPGVGEYHIDKPQTHKRAPSFRFPKDLKCKVIKNYVPGVGNYELEKGSPYMS